MAPLEFMQPLAALVPRPRPIRLHALLAPNARLRAAIVPGPAHNAGVPADEHVQGAPTRMGWARLLRRVFNIDLEHCPQCGGDLKIIAAIEEPALFVRILTHLGLACPRAAALNRRGRCLSSRRPDNQGQNGSAAGPTIPADEPARPALGHGGQSASKSASTGRRRDR